MTNERKVAWRVVYVSGPAVSATVTLDPGRHLMGRERRCSIHVDDDSVEPHHAVLDIGDDGSCRVTQIAGRLAVLVDGAPCAGTIVELADRGADAIVEIGATRLRLLPPSGSRREPAPVALQTGDVPGEVGGRMVVRPPRAAPATEVPWVEVPPGPNGPTERPVGAGPLVTSLIGAVAAIAMGAWLGQPTLAVFALVGSAASGLTWVVQRVRSARAAARAAALIADEHEAFRRRLDVVGHALRSRHLADTATVADALDAVATDRLWVRRPWHRDAFTVSIGWGDVPRAIEVRANTGDVAPEVRSLADRAGQLEDVPVAIALDEPRHRIIGISGDLAPAVIRGILVQLAVQAGPADWGLAIVVADPTSYAWASRLPHAAHLVVDATDTAALAADLLRLDDGDRRRLVLVTDLAALLTTRTSPLRRLLDLDRPITVLVQIGAAEQLPAVCTAALRTGPRATARWEADLGASSDGAPVARATRSDPGAAVHGDDGPWRAMRIRVAGVSRAVGAQVADRLEHLVDPEDPTVGSGRLPTTLRLDELEGVTIDRDSVIAAWSSGGVDPAPAAVIGRSLDGVIELDLVRDGPHGLVAGTTGSGKSELLRTLVVSLAARVSPDHLTFVLVDYKGGATFDACADLPHTVGVVTDLDEGLAARALVSLEAELHRRERLLRGVGASDLATYRRTPGSTSLPRLVVVIDEFAALAAELPDFLSALVGIAQRGRSLGVHLVLATQRPAGVIDDAVRANTDLRLALRLNDAADAHDVVGVDEPARFPRGVPGRALMRLGPAEAVVFQAATCTVRPAGTRAGEPDPADGVGPTVLRDAVDVICDADADLGLAEPHRPWLPPLGDLCRTDDPATVDGVVWPETTVDASVPVVVGVMDDPAGQRRLPLRWDRSGNLALIGSLGAGTGTVLATVGAALLRAGDAAVYAIDARGDGSLTGLDPAGSGEGVIALHDRERIDRVLRRLAEAVDRRRTGSGAPVLLVNGLGALRRALDDATSLEAATLLDRVLAEGPAVGVTVAATLDADGAALVLLPRFAERWVFHLDDPGQGPGFGVSASRVPPPLPGRLHVTSTGFDAQVMTGVPALGATRGRAGATRSGGTLERVEVLPASVPLAHLPQPSVDADGTLHLPLGLRSVDLAPALVQVPPGEHLLIVGPGRSGRSTSLEGVLTGWRSVHPDGDVWVVTPSGRGAWQRATGVQVARSVAHLPSPRADRPPTLVVVVDAERVEDVDGRLAVLLGDGRPGDLVAAAGRPDALRSAFGHWTGLVRRSRLGLVMAAASELDGDLLGAVLPRRCPIRPRPGLAWMIGPEPPTLVQVATDQGW